MSFHKICFVALALTLAIATGCKKKSNTVEGNQQQPTGATGAGAGTATTGSDTNPNMPNPTGAESGTPMGSAQMQAGAGGAVIDAGVGDGGMGSAGAAGSGASGSAAGSAK